MENTMDRMQALRAPGAFLLALEGRAPLEFGATLAAWPLLKTAPRGDGHAVIVFPGLGAGDFSTVPLRNFLSSHGYDTYGWDLGLNFGPREGVLKKSVERVRQIHKDTGRTVSLIGWSLGGIYAREFAKALPDHVRSVITLGTPFAGDPKATNAWRLYEFASGHKLDDPDLLRHLKEAPPVPTTSIFSRTDGVVAAVISARNKAGGKYRSHRQSHRPWHEPDCALCDGRPSRAGGRRVDQIRSRRLAAVVLPRSHPRQRSGDLRDC